MLYLVLTYQGEQALSGLSEGERHIIAEARRENDVALRESGSLQWGISLHIDSPTPMISLQDGDVSMSDSGMPLAGIYVIRANDMNAAIRTASVMPQAQLGTIEVQSVVSMDVV
jgi:hypothetical protein